ncbi:Sapep family Mn(2+)-dependent dipeptidase [Spiroplasma culicicola]|uniref:Dipeptidase PepV n=1 Tax=Spiroplasma culicicola AES-1 TaxID=1276246 RepID=W6A6J8_9MOLU|nr:Sapep family Mn(2+)-dependent dipeptidase [Spiroplasma culicicola]AHI52627.1 dipeptidase PepV [Spiroplasma culicicola AES-1]
MEVNKTQLLGTYFEQALEETQKIIQIPSYRRDLTFGAPVHEDIVKVLDHCLDLCKQFGFKTFKAVDNRYGYADYGTGEKLFGIICHLDVVPAGNLSEWNNPPFEPIIKDNKLFGRGSFDDKGPTMMNLFAFKYLIDNGFKPDYTIRFIFGTSEETNWECMEAYVENERLCDLGYVPDGHFPVVYAEKWISDIDLTGQFDCDFTINGGQVYNAVNDLVTYQGKDIEKIQQYLTANKIESYVEENTLFVKGVSAHGSLPFKGVCASSWLLSALDSIGVIHPLVQFVAKYGHNNTEMREIFGDLTDETGNLTACNGIIKVDSKEFKYTFNFRIPCTRDPHVDVNDKLTQFVKPMGISTKVVSIEEKVYFSKESDVVKNIMQVYREVTGDFDAQPIAIGGGTFAKSMPNMIAFGAEFDMNDSTMHAYNEYVKIDDLKKMMEIYAKSMTKLMKF